MTTRFCPDGTLTHANLALDIGKIISSDRDFLKLIETDIDRFHQPNPARVPIGRRQQH